MPSAAFRPVDSARSPRQVAGVSKKPHKAEESAAPYVAKKPAMPAAAPAQSGTKTIDLEEVKRTNAKLMQVHRTVLQKLAQ